MVDAMRSTVSAAIVNKLFIMSINPWLRNLGVEDILFALFSSERKMNGRDREPEALVEPDRSARDRGRDRIEGPPFNC